MDRKVRENLLPLPNPILYRTFLTVRAKVYRDGYVAYDGVRYGVPSAPAVHEGDGQQAHNEG